MFRKALTFFIRVLQTVVFGNWKIEIVTNQFSKTAVCNTLMKKGSAFRGIGQDKAYSSHCLIILAFSYLHKSDSHRKPLILEFLPVSTLRCQQPGNTLKQPFYLPPMPHLTPKLDDRARSCFHVVVVNHVISGHVLPLSITWSVAMFYIPQGNVCFGI